MKTLNEYLISEKLHFNKNMKIDDIKLLVFQYHYHDHNDSGEQFFIINNDDKSIGEFLSIHRREDFETDYNSKERDDELKMEIEIFKKYINDRYPDLDDIKYYKGYNDEFNPTRNYVIYSFDDFIEKIHDNLDKSKWGWIDLENI